MIWDLPIACLFNAALNVRRAHRHMLSCSRCCLIINKQRYKLPRDPLTEPLLFLYPRWVRAAAYHQQFSTTPITIPRRTWTDLGQLLVRGQSIARTTRTKFPRRVRAGVDAVDLAHASISDQWYAQKVSFSQYEAIHIPQNSQTKAYSRKNQLAPSAEASRSWNNVTEPRTTLPPSATPNSQPGNTTQTLDERHSLPELIIRRTGQPAYRQVLTKSPESTTKTIKKAATKNARDPSLIEWSEPIRLLAQLTYRPKKAFGERLELHRNTVYNLTGSLEANAWFHPVRSGCEVRVLSERVRHRDKLAVMLHGMPRARQLTRAHLVWIEHEVAKSASRSLSSEDKPVLVRFVLSSLPWHCRIKDVRRADRLQQPPSWTVRSFADFVETLTTMQIPRQLRRELYGDADSHNRTVATVLQGLFSDPQSESCISLGALNNALRFTCAHTELDATSSFLFEKAKSIGLSIQADTYNILIEQALRKNKLDHYRSLLASMRHTGVVPNEMTWVALLRVTKSRNARRAILQRLRHKWPKENKVWQHVAIELVTTDFARLVRLEKSFDYFVDFMDQSLPSDWLSARCINRMLNVCAEKKLWDVVPRVVELSERRGGFFNTGTHSALLKVFQKRGSIRDSISLLESHFAKTVVRDSAFAIPMVFMTAWNSRFYNVCRVLWHYAAVSGIIALNMQKVVVASLIKNHDKSNQSASHLWRITAGKVIVGTDLDLSGLASQYRFFNQDRLKNPVKALAEWTPDDGPRQEQLSLAYTIIQRDLGAYKRFWQLHSQQLFDLLKMAYELDCEWMHKKKVRRYSDLSWMIDDAIKVPLKPLPSPSVSPQHLLWPTGKGIGDEGRFD